MSEETNEQQFPLGWIMVITGAIGSASMLLSQVELPISSVFHKAAIAESGVCLVMGIINLLIFSACAFTMATDYKKLHFGP